MAVFIIFMLFLLLVLGYLLSSGTWTQASARKTYGRSSVTTSGYVVKSNAEKIISDYLTQQNIHHEYERELRTKSFFGGRKISNPDFYLSDYDVYIEYWGLVDADDEKLRQKYVREMRWKMAQYYSMDIKFISIYPDNMKNLDRIFRSKFKKVTGKDLH